MKIKMSKCFENFLAGFCLISLLLIFFFMGCSIRANVVIKDVNVGDDNEQKHPAKEVVKIYKPAPIKEVVKQEVKQIVTDTGLKNWGEINWSDDKRAKEKERGIKKALEVYPVIKNQKNLYFYTVGTWKVDRDCLWNIARKLEIYRDPYMWPYIYAANLNLIGNDPDIIQPGMVLAIPVFD